MESATGLMLDRPVPPQGYAWWYLDGVSDAGDEAFTLIAFVGSVFSPYYAWSGREAPEDHVSLNVALYGRTAGESRWALTERGRGSLTRTASTFQVGPSRLAEDGGAVVVEVDEWSFPVPRRVRGRVTLRPLVRGGPPLLLESHGAHHWWPVAPKARVEVAFDSPKVAWEGTGYLDSNWGALPLEASFKEWTWSRAPLSDGAAVLYDVVPRHSEPRTMALRFDGRGPPARFESPPAVDLPRSLFALPRQTRSEAGAQVVRTLTDTHFYARSLVQARLCGEDVVGVHESLSLERFGTGWAKALLPFRMPRAA